MTESDASTQSLPSPVHKSSGSHDSDVEEINQIILSDSDDDLKRAIALSIQVVSKPTEQRKSASVLGIDRAQMERERLARLGQSMPLKRKASPTPLEQKDKKPSHWEPPFLKHVIAAPQTQGKDTLTNLSLSDIIHPNGSHARENYTGFFLVRAFITSYDWDQDFNYVLSRLPLLGYPSSVLHSDKAKEKFANVMLGVQSEDDTKWGKRETIGGGGHQSISICHAPLRRPGSTYNGVFHPKIGMLSYANDQESFLRIFISTANVNSRDYEMCDNLVFAQDFPLSTKQEESEMGNEFRSYFQSFLRAMECIPLDMMTSLDKYDFSKVTVKLVASIPGRFHGSEWGLWGASRLCKVINSFGMSIPPFAAIGSRQDRLQIECQTSSVGRLDYQYMHNFYACCSGNPVAPLYSKSPSSNDLPIKIIYPSRSNVERVGVRRPGIEALFLQRKYWGEKNYCTEYFRESDSKKGVHSHTKTILGTVKDKWCWMYIGSHNLSKAAWGFQMKKDMDGYPYVVNNWEMGLVLKCDEKQADAILRYRRPAEKYDSRGPFCRDDM
jgi:hypothetical protein